MFDFEHDEVEDGERSYGERLEEAAEMVLGDSERLDYKDHGSTDGCLVYYGGETNHRIELTHPEKQISPGFSHLPPAVKLALVHCLERLADNN